MGTIWFKCSCDGGEMRLGELGFEEITLDNGVKIHEFHCKACGRKQLGVYEVVS